MASVFYFILFLFFMSQVLCLVIIWLWIIACPFGSFSFCIKLQQPFAIILGSLSVNDCSPRMFWAVINGESSLQTAVHVKGTLQVFLSHQNSFIIAVLTLAIYKTL